MAYGFEAYRSDASTMISSKDGVARLIYAADFDDTYSGTVSVPAFDSSLGYFTTRMYPFKHIIDAGSGFAPMSDSSSHTVSDGTQIVSTAASFAPSLSWNNSTKVLTITANSDTEDFYIDRCRHRYRLFMVHYK